jgi:uncharacterized membrane protein YdjX (TVP38/TMEM64 family)
VRFAGIWPLAVLAALAVAGIVLDALDIVDWRLVLEWARSHAADWRLAAVIVAIQVALFTFALPGSSLVWVAAVLYPAPVAALILTAGGTGGALGAYLFAHRVTRRDAAAMKERRLYRLIEAQGDFFTLCALRVLPGFPHSVINYAAGTLRLHLPLFLAATLLGLAVKSFLYCLAIAELIETAAPADLLQARILAPLFGIALLLFLGRFMHARWLRSRE